MTQQQLLRRYIARRLADYYAQPSHLVVGGRSLDESQVDFRSLWGEWHWRRVYQRHYDGGGEQNNNHHHHNNNDKQHQQNGQWLTPVELFRPYYSQAMVEYCVQQYRQLCRRHQHHEHENGTGQPLFDVVELGGGRGTNATCFLSYLLDAYPEIYDQLSTYTIVDASPTLQALQQETLTNGDSCGKDHTSKLRFVLRDLTDVAEAKAPLFATQSTGVMDQMDPTPTLFLALELFDNLGHDKIRWNVTTRSWEQAEVTMEEEEGKGGMMEVFRPLSDALLKRILQMSPSYGQKLGGPVWLPSVACGILLEIAKSRPNSWIVVADFDSLPHPDLKRTSPAGGRRSLWAESEPLVTDMEDVDYECYLNSPHLTDILYPTDFKRLSTFCQKAFLDSQNSLHPKVEVVKQATFLQDVAPEQVQQTQSRWTGYSPMVDDFFNCSILTVSKESVPVHNEKSRGNVRL